MTKFESFIFDLDGTLVGSSPEHRYILVGRVLEDLGVYPRSDLIDSFWFEARRDELVTKMFGLSLEAFWSTYKKYDTIELRERFTKPYNDISVIKELRRNGHKTGIVTGAPLHIANLEINMIGRENFDSIIIAHRSNGFIPKPNPQGLEECLRQLNTQKNKAVYVGNADEDIEMAKRAEVFDILLDRREHKFPDVAPSLTISSLYELRALS